MFSPWLVEVVGGPCYIPSSAGEVRRFQTSGGPFPGRDLSLRIDCPKSNIWKKTKNI